MANIVIRPETREQWLIQRQNGIGSSEVATIIGVNPYETPYQLWRRKKGLDPAKEENFAMRAGHYLEDAVARFFADETGREIIKSSASDFIIADADRPYLQVSPDRTYWLGGKKSNGNKAILECKTTQRTVDPDDIPRWWFVQLQYQLGVAGMEHGSLAWLSAGREFGYKDIALVPDFYDWVVSEVDRFWKDNVVGGAEPDAVNAADVMVKYARHVDGKSVEITPESYVEVSDLKEVRSQMSELEERKKALEDKVKMMFADAEALTYGGSTIATWKTPKPGRKFDEKRFKNEHPDMWESYCVESQGARRLLIK